MSSIEQVTVPRSEAPRRTGGAKRVTLWIAAVLMAALLLAAGIIPRIQKHVRATGIAQAATSGLQNVLVVNAKLTSGSADLELPGNIQAINLASIYARTNGYVEDRFVDIGTPVKAGQLLARIQSPEVDQELAQARAAVEQSRASLEQAKANLAQAQAQVIQARANVSQSQANEEIASTTNERWTRLVDKGVLPRQAGDERRTTFNARHAETAAAAAAQTTSEASVNSRTADIAAAHAAIDAQLANVRRLEQLQSFERVVAPFDGIVTERRIEKGDLITAGSGSDRNLFSVAQSRTLRVQVTVPQSYAVDLQPGQDAEVTLRERPGEVFHGKIARTAGSVVASTRTLLTEVQVDNPSGRLLPGMYGEVKFTLPRSHPVVLIPGSALIANSEGTKVAQVQAGKRVHLITVQPGRDLGTEVEILSGLTGPEEVINNPPDNLTEGQEVNVVQTSQGGKQ